MFVTQTAAARTYFLKSCQFVRNGVANLHGREKTSGAVVAGHVIKA